MPPGAPPAPKDLGQHNLQRRGSQAMHPASPRKGGRRAPSHRARRPLAAYAIPKDYFVVVQWFG